MKKKELKYLMVMGGISLILIACKKDATPVRELSITSFTEHAKGGDIIEIIGSGFTDVPALNSVKINGVEALVTKATEDRLEVKVPAKAGDGEITIKSVTDGREISSGTKLFSYDWIGKSTQVVYSSTNNPFWALMDVVADLNGSLIGSDAAFNRLRTVSTDGKVTPCAGDEGMDRVATEGYVDGESSSAKFRAPRGVAMDAEGNLYVADAGNDRIRKITQNRTVSTLVPEFTFSRPSSVAVDTAGILFVTDTNNKRVCKINKSGVISIIAGTGSGNSTETIFNKPGGIAIDKTGNMYVSDGSNGNIYKIKADGSYTLVAEKIGNRSLELPYDLALDKDDNLYVADADGKRILKIGESGRVITLIADSIGTPTGLALDKNGVVYAADVSNNRIFKITQE